MGIIPSRVPSLTSNEGNVSFGGLVLWQSSGTLSSAGGGLASITAKSTKKSCLDQLRVDLLFFVFFNNVWILLQFEF